MPSSKWNFRYFIQQVLAMAFSSSLTLRNLKYCFSEVKGLGNKKISYTNL